MARAPGEIGAVLQVQAGRSAAERWAGAVADLGARARWADLVVEVPGSACLWWTGAISGRGHGRFWVGPGHVVIAHRFAFAVRCGVEALVAAPLLGHGCDNPLCQRVDVEHVGPSTARANRREWAARRDDVASPLADPRGARVRAEALRALARVDPGGVQLEVERVRASLPEQLQLW